MAYLVCAKCEKIKGKNCVYYSQVEKYLCNSCYKEWLKIDKTYKHENYKLIEKDFLDWLQKG